MIVSHALINIYKESLGLQCVMIVYSVHMHKGKVIGHIVVVVIDVMSTAQKLQ